jgi:hypothetical protein
MYNSLQNYMFTNENINNKYNSYLIKLYDEIGNKKEKTETHNYYKTNTLKNNDNNNENKYFTPASNDKLFWIFYILLYGFDTYNLNIKYEFKTEKQFKIELVDKLRENKTQIKLLKYKLIDLENELVNDKTISLKMFHVLCFLFNKSVLYVNDKIYYDFNYGDSYSLIYYLYNNPKLFMNNEKNLHLINNIKTKYILINPAKPIKGITSYKIKELQDMAIKLNIEINNNQNKKKTKLILYDEINFKIKKLM